MKSEHWEFYKDFFFQVRESLEYDMKYLWERLQFQDGTGWNADFGS